MSILNVRRVTAILGATLAIGAATATVPGAAIAGPLPGGVVARVLDDGTRVVVRLQGEKVSLQGSSVSAVPTTREGWLSGKVAVSVNGKSVQYASIYPGYDVGCQVNFSGGGAGAQVGSGLDPNTAYAAPGGSVTLGPGRATWLPVINTTSGDSTAYKYYAVNGYTFTGASGGVAYSQEPFRLNGCAGYASARARIIVEVNTASVKSWVTLLGKPFSLG